MMPIEPPSEEENWAQMEERARLTFWGTLGCEVVSAEPGRAIVSLSCTERHLNMANIVHGGVLASIMDNTMGLAAMRAFPGELLVTAQMNIHYLASAGVGEIRCEAVTVHRSRRTVTMQGHIYGADGGLLAWGSSAFRLVAPER
ncbi:thioesterase superfamily protein [Paenibacillus curdlanolyticus YK9]|uniref:Thioesterase superfamily protein n=1 Tax=Paenibacillus curdlanolyticus YK9 TaxID=717606 RepID=E0IB37_9BACL|nr:PaaI family thioesterase [Paenibacillus curdlanolyticus]EFM10328.1 thioesterase superfamily protein [Paenibacillus curdlanolyticus YK9]